MYKEMSTKTSKRIAIIGAGLSGCGAVVALTEEGLEPVCFESSDAPGGTWQYKEKATPGYASIMPTTTLINSKEMSAISNFPPRKEYNNYMRHSEARAYYMEQYKHSGCGRYIRYNTEVLNVTKSVNYDDTGRFVVSYREKHSGVVSKDTFDGVVVATGQFTMPRIPSFKGIDKFKGSVVHSHSIKSTEEFKGKNVLIIGNGPSGLDAADFISSVTKQVYLSSRSGMFVLSRVGPGGYPIDYVLLRRYLNLALKYLPRNLVSFYVETFYMDPKFDHRLYNIRPKHHLLNRDPIVNDTIFSKLLSGVVVQKGQVISFTENGVILEGEEDPTEIDSVILATGYKPDFPILDHGLLDFIDGRMNLYKCMLPAQLPHHTLLFIGFVVPGGPGVPIGEMQCRWVAQVLSGKVNLPSTEIIQKEAIKRHKENEAKYIPSDYLSVRVDFIEYQDDLASDIGVKPNLLKYFFTDFPLFIKLFFGPSLSYQYRLEGRHKWEGAREAIMSCHERVLWPLTRGKNAKKGILQRLFEFILNFIPRNMFI